MKKTILIGSGGHAQSIMALRCDVLNQVVAYTDIIQNNNFNLLYAGTDDDVIRKYNKEHYNLLIGVSYTGKKISLELRKQIINKYKGYDFQTIIAHSSIIKNNVIIGDGTVIFENTLINTQSKIGTNCVINTGSIIEHHCIIGDNVQISPGCVICGGVDIGDNSFIAAGTTIRDGVKIGDNIIVGLGSVVASDLMQPGLYLGCPVKRISPTT
jgi:sugar O-acyltransferase (sialic acid O-acetyltransferase NeuD family)